MQNLKRFVSLLILLAITQLAIACGQVAVASDFQPVNNWQPAALAAPPGLMEQVVKENIKGEWLGDPGRMSIMKIQEPGQQNPLYLINSRIIRDCSPRGCDPLEILSVVVLVAPTLVISKMVNPIAKFLTNTKFLLPPDVPFMRVSKQLSSGLPCLAFAELPNTMADSLQIRRFCYKGNKYEEKVNPKNHYQTDSLC